MTARRLLLLDASGLTAYHWQSGHLHDEGRFPGDDTGLLAFGEYLRSCRNSLFRLLVDVAEEGFQIEDVPYVQGRDRHALIERKLGQFFYGSPLATAISLGRQKHGRRDERLLFAGLTGYAHIEPWLQAMRQAEAPLAGIHPMPMVLASALGPLVTAAERTLVISITHAGLRQTFFEQGQLRFSRLTSTVGSNIEEVAIACALETDKIYQYLASQRLIVRGTPLSTLVLAHPDHASLIHSHCPDTPERQIRFVDLLAQGRQKGLRTRPLDSCSEGLFLHMLVQRPPRQQLAPAAERRFYRLWQARSALRAASLATLGLCLVVAGQQAMHWLELTATNEDLRSQVDDGRARYERVLRTLPKVPVSNEELRLLTNRYAGLQPHGANLDTLLRPLSHGLDRTPGVELIRLEWKLASSPDGTAEGGQRNSGRPPADGRDRSPAFALLDVEARLPAEATATPRRQQRLVEELAAAIAADSGVTPTILAMPVETAPGKTIRGGGEGTAVIGPPVFRLRLARKL